MGASATNLDWSENKNEEFAGVPDGHKSLAGVAKLQIDRFPQNRNCWPVGLVLSFVRVKKIVYEISVPSSAWITNSTWVCWERKVYSTNKKHWYQNQGGKKWKINNHTHTHTRAGTHTLTRVIIMNKQTQPTRMEPTENTSSTSQKGFFFTKAKEDEINGKWQSTETTTTAKTGLKNSQQNRTKKQNKLWRALDFIDKTNWGRRDIKRKLTDWEGGINIKERIVAL